MNHLIPIYRKLFNFPHAEFLRIDHADVMVAVVYKITHPTGEQFILKICDRNADYLREQYFLHYLAGKIPVPKIIDIVAPDKNIHGAILMEYFTGTLLNANDLTPALAYEIGTVLAKIHSNRAIGYGDLIQPAHLSNDPRIHFKEKFEEGIAECRNQLSESLLDQCIRYFDMNINILNKVDGPCIIHRDFRPGNIMISDGKLQGIIDWSSGRASFAEEDFCPLEFEKWEITPDSKRAFLDGYKSIRPLPDYETVMPLLKLSKAIATIGFTVKRGLWNTSHTNLYKANYGFLEKLLNK